MIPAARQFYMRFLNPPAPPRLRSLLVASIAMPLNTPGNCPIMPQCLHLKYESEREGKAVGSFAAGCLVSVILLCVATNGAFAQFTQGPPGNPSAAGITMGTPPPAPLPPRPVSPLPSTSLERGAAPAPYLLGKQEDNATEDLLQSEGLPPLLLASPGSALAHRLNLSEEQLESIRKTRMKLARETRDVRYRLQQKRLQMQHFFADPQASGDSLLKLHGEIMALNQKLHDATGRAGIEARRFLRPEQLELLEF
jgi:hypothetical protein